MRDCSKHHLQLFAPHKTTKTFGKSARERESHSLAPLLRTQLSTSTDTRLKTEAAGAAVPRTRQDATGSAAQGHAEGQGEGRKRKHWRRRRHRQCQCQFDPYLCPGGPLLALWERRLVSGGDSSVDGARSELQGDHQKAVEAERRRCCCCCCSGERECERGDDRRASGSSFPSQTPTTSLPHRLALRAPGRRPRRSQDALVSVFRGQGKGRGNAEKKGFFFAFLRL